MKYLPIENITYRTKLKEDEVIKRLSDFIEPKRNFRVGVFGRNSSKPYEGEITAQAFDIKRIINYRNSFLPVITGVINGGIHETTIQVKMRLNSLVIAFGCVWFGGIGFACLVCVYALIFKTEFHVEILIPFAMLLFGYALFVGGFKFESNISKQDLAKLFEAETNAL